MRIGPAALAACVACPPLITAGCNGSETAAPPPRPGPPPPSRSPRSRAWTNPSSSRRPAAFRPTSRPTSRPESSGRVMATPVDVGQHVAKGAVLIRIQAVDANLRLDEARAAVQRAEANLKLAESQNALAQTTAQAQRGAAEGRADSADDGRRGADAGGDLGEQCAGRARVAGAGPGAAGARGEGGLGRGRGGAVRRLHQPAPRGGGRVRAAVDRRGHAAPHRSAAPAAHHPERPGGPGRHRTDGDRARRCVPGQGLRGQDQRRQSADRRRIALVHRRSARCRTRPAS